MKPFILTLSVFFFLLSCKNQNNNSYYEDNEESETAIEESLNDGQDFNTEEISISDLSCDELLQLVQNDGSRLEYLDQSDMNSSALDYIALYEYDGVYYVVIEFTSSSQEYIYCDISRNYWDAFVENEDNSFGSGYHNYIRPYTSCNCGR